MSRYTVGIVGRDSKPHRRCFEDHASAMSAALRAIGHDVVPFTDGKPGRLIMFGANSMNDPYGYMPEDAILFNAEQVATMRVSDPLLRNLNTYRKRVIWDYSAANAAKLRGAGFERVVHCPVGYIPSMTKIPPASVENIDVLFIGSMSERRKEILLKLINAGLKVERLFNIYGDERDAYIARAKVVLNLHFYEPSIFEMFRVSHLLANRKCVVTEDGGHDLELESFAQRACVYTGTAGIVERCREMVADERARVQAAARGFAEFKKLDLVSYVRCALEGSQ